MWWPGAESNLNLDQPNMYRSSASQDLFEDARQDYGSTPSSFSRASISSAM